MAPGTYRMRDHSSRSVVARVTHDGAILDLGSEVGLGPWLRHYPEGAPSVDLDRLAPADSLFLRRLSPKTLWLRLPDFAGSRLEPLEALLASFAADIATTDNLLLDLRDNGGGNDQAFQPLIPLLYTRPIYTIGIEYRATAYNAAVLRQMAIDWPQWREGNEKRADLMAAHLGEFVNPGGRGFWIDHRDTMLAYPKRIAVLLDRAGSSGEQFLLTARQSRKVTLFGKQNSFGCLDISNVVFVPTPSDRFWLMFATSRSMRLPEDPVDPDGIAPDIRIPADVEDPVGYAQSWLERQVD